MFVPDAVMCMNFYSSIIIFILTLVCCISKLNATSSDAELQQDRMTVSEQDFPKYDMRDLDTKELAELLMKEKRVGVPNDSAFADFFRRCGMEYGELPEGDRFLEYKYHVSEGYYKIYKEKASIKAISVYYKSEEGIIHHTIAISFPKGDTNRLQWMTVQLRAFGMRDVRSEAVKLEGKGLRGFGMRGYFEISY